MMTNTKFLHVVLLAVAFASCSKTPVVKPAPQPEPNPVINALSKVSYSNGDYDSLFYNSDLLLVKIKMHTTIVNPFDQVFTFEYDANKKIKRIADNTGESFDYLYANGELVSVKHNIGSRKVDFKLYDYTNGKLTGIEEYYQENFNQPGYLLTAQHELTYYDDGNLKSQTIYAYDQARTKYKQFTALYENYDGKQNPHALLSQFMYFFQLPLSKNNAGKMTWKDEVNGATTVLDYTYTYNDFLNPLTLKTRNNGVNESEATFHYY